MTVSSRVYRSSRCTSNTSTRMPRADSKMRALMSGCVAAHLLYHNLRRLSTDHAVAFPPSEHAFNLILEHLAKRPVSRSLYTPGLHSGSLDHHPFRPACPQSRHCHATCDRFRDHPPRFRISPPECVDKDQIC